jgi:hypothetical protein
MKPFVENQRTSGWVSESMTRTSRRSDLCPNLVPLAREAAMMAMRVEAAALRRDINEAQILIGRLQRRYLNDNKRNGHHRLRTAIGGGSSPCGSGAGWAAAVDRCGGCATGPTPRADRTSPLTRCLGNH